MRCIDKAGGFDSYIYHTAEKDLQSKLGMALKMRMKEVVQKFKLEQPEKVARLPRRARYLDKVEGEENMASVAAGVSQKTRHKAHDDTSSCV